MSICCLIFKPHYYAGWPAYQTGVKVIFSSWKMTNCLWKVLGFLFDKAVRILNVVLKERWHFALLWPMALEISTLTNLCLSRKATPFIQRNEKIGPTSNPLDKEEGYWTRNLYNLLSVFHNTPVKCLLWIRESNRYCYFSQYITRISKSPKRKKSVIFTKLFNTF